MIVVFFFCPISAAKIISSHSWKVDLSGSDEYVDIVPRMKSFDADQFSSEDMAEHSDDLYEWEHDDMWKSDF